MEFWGVEVKAGEPFKVTPEAGTFIHVSQVALGESKKDKANEPVHIYVNIDNQKIVLGTLSTQNIPQLSFDLNFEKYFELSHNWKHGSVYFCGYVALLPEEEGGELSDDSEDESEDESESEEDEDKDKDKDIPLVEAQNGEVKVAVAKCDVNAAKPVINAAKPDVNAAKRVVTAAKPGSDSDDESDSDEESDEDTGSDEDDSEEGMDDLDDDVSGSESEDEETPKKVEPSKKRAIDSATKTPVSSKKAKPNTPQKTDGKKLGHTATPHPAKQGGKNAANGNKLQTPKSGGQFSCGSCSKSFGSDGALQSHTKAKHSGK